MNQLAWAEESMRRMIAGITAPPPPPPVDVKQSGADDGGMEARVSRLEDIAHESAKSLASMESKLDRAVGELSQMKWWFIGTIVSIFLATYGASVSVQQMTVATFQAAQAQPQQQAQPTVIVVPAMPAPAASR